MSNKNPNPTQPAKQPDTTNLDLNSVASQEATSVVLKDTFDYLHGEPQDWIQSLAQGAYTFFRIFAVPATIAGSYIGIKSLMSSDEDENQANNVIQMDEAV
jgi:hypothetical protein